MSSKMSCGGFALLLSLLLSPWVRGAEVQRVEGFDKIADTPGQFDFQAKGRTKVTRDFRGKSRGYMTAQWWAEGQMKDNRVAWLTAAVPQSQETTFAFVGASYVVPTEFTRGQSARLTVNGKEAVTFPLGFQRDIEWKQGDFELKFTVKRLEFPYSTNQRQNEIAGISGVYELTVPASAVEKGKPALLQVEVLPEEGKTKGWFMVKAYRDVWSPPTVEQLQGQIEALQQDMAESKQLTQALASQVYAGMLDEHDMKHQVIYRNGLRHLHPADLIKLKNGDLLLMAREGTEHIANDGDVFTLRSKDGGLTWGEKQFIASIKNLDEREGCGIQLKDGTIVVGIFYNNLYGTDGVYKSGGVPKPPEWGGADHAPLGCYYLSSKDDGHTWSAPAYVDIKGMPFSSLEGPTDAPIEMSDGSIVMGVIGYGLDNDSKNIGTVMLRSTDQAKTWTYLSTIASDPGGKLGGFVEPGIVRTKTGRIIAAMRNHGVDQALWVAWSDDNGKTWSPVKETKMVGHPADLVQLSDGRILATYGIRTDHARPQGVRACFSKDNGQTWDIAHEVVLRSDFMNWDVGYPESMELPDGRIFTVYYYNLFGRYFIGGTTWKP